MEELGAGISDNKAAVSSLALPHPSCGGGELGFFFLVELQRLKLAGREVLGGLINKLDELSSKRVVAVELSILALSLYCIVVVTIGERKWPGLWLHTGILLQIVDQYVVASVCCHIFVPSGIIWSTPTAALHRRDAVAAVSNGRQATTPSSGASLVLAPSLFLPPGRRAKVESLLLLGCGITRRPVSKWCCPRRRHWWPWNRVRLHRRWRRIRWLSLVSL